MSAISLNAYAKVNLSLDVIGKRPNGYHDLRMVMQTVDLYDVITMDKIPNSAIELTINIPGLEADESNLCYKAAKFYMDEYGIKEGVKIHLEKNIPMAAGMAGGSTDAAAVLKGMEQLFAKGATTEKLCELGVKCGADVPYCIIGGTALAEGIGEVLTPLPNVPACPLVLCKPNFDVSTKFVYTNLHLDTLEAHPDVDGMVEDIKAGDLEAVAAKMGNVLETVTETKYTDITEIKKAMVENGAFASMMSGSGPTVFGLCKTVADATKAAEALKVKYPDAQIFVSSFKNMN